MKKNDLIFIISFVLIITLSLTYLFQTSYAKYRRQITSNVEANIAKWNIKVNDETINGKSTLTKSIKPTFDESDYVSEDVIAPGTTGYFDLIIDATDVDVDFTYELTESNTTNTLTDLKITGYEESNYDKSNIKTFSDKITGTITKNTKEKKIRFYIEWVDDDTNSMNNEEDTNYSINNSSTNITISIKFEQKKK
jgi:hypothetical protein